MNHRVFFLTTIPGVALQAIRNVAAACLRELSIAPQWIGALGFTFKIGISSMLAFWIACKLQLDQPVWAMMTVWIVARPQPGQVISRALYRMIGTVLGSVFGVALIALYAQTPSAFVAALAVLMGVCTLVANLLTNLRSYAAALAGYTTAVVSLGSVGNPENVFYVAMARGSCILLGIVCALIVTMLLSRHSAPSEAKTGLKVAIVKAAERLAFPWQGDNAERLRIGKTLIDHLIAMDTKLDMAAAESRVFRIHRTGAKTLLVHLFGVISSRRGLDRALRRREDIDCDPAISRMCDDCIAFLEGLPKRLVGNDPAALLIEISTLRSAVAALEPEKLAIGPYELIVHRVLIDRLDEVLRVLEDSLRGWIALDGEKAERPFFLLNFHRDHRAALVSGLRTTITVGGVGAFWIASAWSHGTWALIVTCILMTLISMLPHPDKIGWKFFQAGVLGAAAAFVCKFWALNYVSNFESFAIVMALFLGPIGVMLCFPKTMAFANVFPLVFLTEVAPTNLMTFNLTDFLNVAFAATSGVFVGAISYGVIFPPDVLETWRYIIFRCRGALETIANTQSNPPFEQWSTRMYDRVTRLSDAKKPANVPDQWLETGLGAVDLGSEIFRIRHLLEIPELGASVRTILTEVLESFRNFTHRPQVTINVARVAHSRIFAEVPPNGLSGRRSWARAAGAIEAIDAELALPWSFATRGEAISRP